MQRSEIGLLEVAAFLSCAEDTRLANVGSWAMARTQDMWSPRPDIAPTTPSRPTVAVSMALPSRITTTKPYHISRRANISGKSLMAELARPRRSIKWRHSAERGGSNTAGHWAELFFCC